MSDAHLHSLLLLENPFACLPVYLSVSVLRIPVVWSDDACLTLQQLSNSARFAVERARTRTKQSQRFSSIKFIYLFIFIFDDCTIFLCTPRPSARLLFVSDLIFFLAYLLIIMTGEMITLYGHKRTKGICVYWCCNCAVSRVYCIAFACCRTRTKRNHNCVVVYCVFLYCVLLLQLFNVICLLGLFFIFVFLLFFFKKKKIEHCFPFIVNSVARSYVWFVPAHSFALICRQISYNVPVTRISLDVKTQ